MAVLPKNLSMIVQRLANFNRQTIRVRPMSNDSAGPGQTIVFRFPSNTIIDLHNLQLKAEVYSSCKCTVGSKSYYTELGLPRYSNALFERVDVTVGGTTITGSNLDYGGLYTILRDALCSSVAKKPCAELQNSWENPDRLRNMIHLQTADNDLYNDQVVTLTEYAQNYGGTPVAPRTDTNLPSNETFDGVDYVAMDGAYWKRSPMVFDGFVGFLGGKFVRFLDTSITGAVEIRLRLAPLTACWGPQVAQKSTDEVLQGAVSGIDTRTGTYQLRNLYMMLDTISFTDDFYRQLLARRLIEGGSIVIPYDNYFSIQKYIGGTSDTVTFNVATQSLDYLIGTLRRSDYNTSPGTLGLCEVEVNNGIVRSPSYNSNYYTFVSGASNDMTGNATYQWLVANALVPTWPADVNDVWMLNQAAMDIANQISDVGNSETHYEFRRGKFAHIVAFNHHAETEKFISGLDTRGASSNMQWMVNGLSQPNNWRTVTGGSPGTGKVEYNATVWACCTSTIEISAGQNITVIF